MADGYRRDSVSRPFLARKQSTNPRTCHRHATRCSSSSRMGSSACRGTVVVLMDHTSARPGDNCAHGRVRRDPHPDSPARRYGRQDTAVGAGAGTRAGAAQDAKTGTRWSAGINDQTGSWGRKEARDADKSVGGGMRGCGGGATGRLGSGTCVAGRRKEGRK